MNSTALPYRRRMYVAPALAGLLALGLFVSIAGAQPAQPAQPVQPAPQPPAGAQPAPQPPAAVAAQPPGTQPPGTQPPGTQPPAAKPPGPPVRDADPLAVALAPQPGGLTPDEVARAAIRTKPSLRAKQAELRAAAAKVDQAYVAYFPRVTLTASYTRLSEVENATLGGGGFSVGALNPGGLRTAPCPGGIPLGPQCIVDSQGVPVQAVSSSFEFPSLNNVYSFVASVVLPVSDYVFRISQGYAAASHAESAKKLEVAAEALQIAADAKISFYNWVRAKGQVVVAAEAVSQANAHVADARRTLEVGLISRADVLRLEAQVASSEQLLASAQAFLAVADEQLRIAIAPPAGKELTLGTDVMAAPSGAPVESLQALQREALRKRLEIRALDETVYSLKEVESVTKAAYLPRLDAFADLTYANPNQRIFPQEDKFTATWDAGLRLTWTVNDTFTTIGAAAEAKARTQTVEEQKAVLRDGLRLEVASAHADVLKAASTIEAASRQLAAAEESMRVRLELFRAGRATSVDVVDAETEVTRARLQVIDARIGLLVAKTRLEHATGRDVRK